MHGDEKNCAGEKRGGASARRKGATPTPTPPMPPTPLATARKPMPSFCCVTRRPRIPQRAHTHTSTHRDPTHTQHPQNRATQSFIPLLPLAPPAPPLSLARHATEGRGARAPGAPSVLEASAARAPSPLQQNHAAQNVSPPPKRRSPTAAALGRPAQPPSASRPLSLFSRSLTHTASHTQPPQQNHSLQKNAGLLTQEELLELLREDGRRADARADDPTSAALPSERRLCQQALLPAAGPPHPGGSAGCRAALGTLVAELRNLGLTRREALMCADLRPRSAVELHAIVSDCDERLVAAAGGGEGEGGGGGSAGDGGATTTTNGVDAALAAVARHVERRRREAEAAAAEAVRQEQAARRRGGGGGGGGGR